MSFLKKSPLFKAATSPSPVTTASAKLSSSSPKTTMPPKQTVQTIDQKANLIDVVALGIKYAEQNNYTEATIQFSNAFLSSNHLDKIRGGMWLLNDKFGGKTYRLCALICKALCEQINKDKEVIVTAIVNHPQLFSDLREKFAIHYAKMLPDIFTIWYQVALAQIRAPYQATTDYQLAYSCFEEIFSRNVPLINACAQAFSPPRTERDIIYSAALRLISPYCFTYTAPEKRSEYRDHIRRFGPDANLETIFKDDKDQQLITSAYQIFKKDLDAKEEIVRREAFTMGLTFMGVNAVKTTHQQFKVGVTHLLDEKPGITIFQGYPKLDTDDSSEERDKIVQLKNQTDYVNRNLFRALAKLASTEKKLTKKIITKLWGQVSKDPLLHNQCIRFIKTFSTDVQWISAQTWFKDTPKHFQVAIGVEPAAPTPPNVATNTAAVATLRK